MYYVPQYDPQSGRDGDETADTSLPAPRGSGHTQTLAMALAIGRRNPSVPSCLRPTMHRRGPPARYYQTRRYISETRQLSLNPPIHVPKTNPDQGDLRDPPLTGSCSSSQDRTILTNSYRRRSGGIFHHISMSAARSPSVDSGLVVEEGSRGFTRDPVRVFLYNYTHGRLRLRKDH